jgi:protein-tyrosine kinase
MSKLKKALERAKEERLQTGQSMGQPEDPILVRQAFGAKPEMDRCDVNPTYECTRVVNIDPNHLVRHRVITVCTENPASDQIKILRSEILNGIGELEGNSFLVTSARDGEGKTLTAINLAISIAQELDRTVLLVDANLRKPAVHRYLGLEENFGLSDYLRNKADISTLLVNPGIKKLTVLPAGKPLANSSELLAAPRMEQAVKEMRARYPDRMIIFDTPPVLTSADALALGRFVDGVVLVVEAEKTSKEDLVRVVELLKDRPIVGTVLNKARG